MRGDVLDTKKTLKKILSGPAFSTVLSAVVAEKREENPEDDLPDPVELREPTVEVEEQLSKQNFPLCELLAFQSSYVDQETLVIAPTHKIGIRWTALGDTEKKATWQAEMLATATVELFANELFGALLSDGGLNAGPVRVVEEDFSPLLPDAQNAFLKGVLVIVEITTYRS